MSSFRSTFDAELSVSYAARTRTDYTDGSSEWKRKKIRNDRTERLNKTTPYGKLLVDIELDTTAGKIKLRVLNPHAWLQHACAHNKLYAELLAAVARAPCHAIFYSDEAKPGNVLRPELARTFTGMYWCIEELPDYLRARQAWWIPVTFIKAVELKRVIGGLAGLYVNIFDVFWGDVGEANLDRVGVLVNSVRIRIRFGFFSHDEKAEHETVGNKGASGTKMCLSCVNAARVRDNTLGADLLVSFKEPDMSKFTPHTVESFGAVADSLAAARDTLNQKGFSSMERASGLRYDGCALIFSRHRAMAAVPDSRYPDWFHNLLASGGVAQYHVNKYVLELGTIGVTLEDIDAFGEFVIYPCRLKRLRRTFFKDRTQKGNDHIKAFASEVHSAIDVLALFTEVIVYPRLRRHADLFGILRDVVEILSTGDHAVRLADTLDALLFAYHTGFVALYIDCAKPKLHYLRHTPGALRRHGVNCSCAGPERLHKLSKTIARRYFNSLETGLLEHTVDQRLRDIADESMYMLEYLLPPVRTGSTGNEAVSKKAITRVGEVKQGDLIFLKNDGEIIVGAVATFFQHVGSAPCNVIVELYERAGEFWRASRVQRAFPCSSIINTPI